MIFTYQVNVSVEIENAADDVHITSAQLKETLANCITIDLLTENSENVLPDGSQIAGINIEW